MTNISLLAAEIGPVVRGTPANFNGFRSLAALLYAVYVLQQCSVYVLRVRAPAVGVSQTLRRWTEGATYIWQGGHHVGYRPTF